MIESQLVEFMLILTRVSAFVGFFTLFSFQQLPRLIKAAIATSLSVFWWGQSSITMGPNQLASIDALNGILLFGREFFIGVTLSIALNMFLMPCKVAGAYIGQELGLSLASISSPGTPDSATLVTRVFETFTILIFFALNLHYFLLLVLDYSFKHFSKNVSVLNLPTEQLIGLLNNSCNYGLMVVGPLALILAIISVCLAILNRAAPTLNLFSVGMSIRTGFGIFCIVLLLPVLLGSFRGYLYRIQEDIEQVLLAIEMGW